MNIIERIKWLITPLYEETFELWGCDGVTVAGERFRYEHDKYIRVTGLNCSAPDWIYVDFKRDGCIKDGKTFYPLQNVASIKWFKADTRVEDVPYHHQIEFTKEEIDALV